MKAPIYIYLSKDMRSPLYAPKFKVRASTTRTEVKDGEIEMKLNMDIPDDIFSKPQLEADVKVEKSTTTVPSITVKANAVSEWLKK